MTQAINTTDGCITIGGEHAIVWMTTPQGTKFPAARIGPDATVSRGR